MWTAQCIFNGRQKSSLRAKAEIFCLFLWPILYRIICIKNNTFLYKCLEILIFLSNCQWSEFWKQCGHVRPAGYQFDMPAIHYGTQQMPSVGCLLKHWWHWHVCLQNDFYSNMNCESLLLAISHHLNNFRHDVCNLFLTFALIIVQIYVLPLK